MGWMGCTAQFLAIQPEGWRIRVAIHPNGRILQVLSRTVDAGTCQCTASDLSGAKEWPQVRYDRAGLHDLDVQAMAIKIWIWISSSSHTN